MGSEMCIRDRVGTVAPEGDLSIPFEYVTEWPSETETEILEK